MDDETKVYEVPSKREGVKALRATVAPRSRHAFEEGDGPAFKCTIEDVPWFEEHSSLVMVAGFDASELN